MFSQILPVLVQNFGSAGSQNNTIRAKKLHSREFPLLQPLYVGENCQLKYTDRIYYSWSARGFRRTADCPVAKKHQTMAWSSAGQGWWASNVAAEERAAEMHSVMTLPASCWCCLLDSVTSDAVRRVSCCHARPDPLACSSPCSRQITTSLLTGI